MHKLILAELWKRRGQFISGSKLAASMGISRVAVWKHIKALKEYGYDIAGISGRGYSLRDVDSIIIPDEIMKRTRNRLIGREVEFFPRVDSTNEVIKRRLQDKQFQEGTVIVAGFQEEGKGRLGRNWESPWGGLWFSFLLCPVLPLPQIALLSLVFALAVARALEDFVSMPCKIKWPNDIYIGGKKVAGILLESSGEIDSARYVIVGIGINVNIGKGELSLENGKNAASLSNYCSKNLNNTDVFVRVLQSVERYYYKFVDQGFVNILEEFKAYCLHLGNEIKVKQGDRLVAGVNVDIDETGNLLVDTGGKIEKISTGDVNII
ncbi:MAG: biotin--[acetyl-CoA-carboxylase] ligase [Syntrophomonadaceae bacterium]|nr:biotin--[acetyl-CoA-carboxylase] ligase [Syntrophomonadaceae bacterium]